jgi:hypothetical protein
VGRREIPEAVKQLGLLERLIFRALYWENERADARALLSTIAARTNSRNLTEKEVEAALVRVQRAVPPGYVLHRTTTSIEITEEGQIGVGGENLTVGQILAEKASEELYAAIKELPNCLQSFLCSLLEQGKSLRRVIGAELFDRKYRKCKSELRKLLLDNVMVKDFLEYQGTKSKQTQNINNDRPSVGDGD